MKTISIMGFALILVGCSRTEVQPAQTSEPNSAQIQMVGLLSNYQLPKQSIIAQTNSNPQIDNVIRAMYQIATNQRLTFDGSRATDGIVIVGKQGQGGQMVLLMSVYTTGNHIAMRDVYNFNGLDFENGMQMRADFLQMLRK